MTPPATLHPATEAHFDGSYLVVPAAENDAIRRSRLSPSSAASIHRCPARMIAERLTPESHDLFGAAELGSLTHTVFERLYQLPSARRTKRETRALVNVAVAEELDGKPEAGDQMVRLRLIASVWRRIGRLWEIEDPSKIIVRSTEWKFDLTIGRTPVLGFIDRIDVELGSLPFGAGAPLKINDLKTGSAPKPWFKKAGVPTDYERQIQTYALALREFDGCAPSSGALLYSAAPKVVPVAVNRTALESTAGWLEEAWDAFQPQQDAGRFAAVKHSFCKWCPAHSICPVASGDAPSVELSFPSTSAAAMPAPTGFRTGTAPAAADRISSEFLPDPFTSAEPTGVIPHEAEDAPSTTDVGSGMATATKYTHIEPKPWEGDLDPATGRLALSSAASIALFGLVETAVEKLADAGQEITAANVKAFTGTLASICATVQTPFRADGIAALGEGSHARVRGAMHTALRTCAPAPFGGTLADWEAWVNEVTKRTRAIAVTAVSLFDAGIPDSPWAALASTDPVATPAAA